MDVDNETITEIRENTAVTREKVENLNQKIAYKDRLITENSEDISDNKESISANEHEIARIKAIGGFLALLATLLAGLHGWVVPFI